MSVISELALWRRLRPQPGEGTAQAPSLPAGDGPLILLHGGGSAAGPVAAALAAPSGTVAFLMPDQGSTRYEEHDFPGFKAEMAKLCPDCQVIYQNANADVALQQQQFNSVLTQGAKVVVLPSTRRGPALHRPLPGGGAEASRMPETTSALPPSTAFSASEPPLRSTSSTASPALSYSPSCLASTVGR